MDLLGVTEMSVQRTWKVSAGELKLGDVSQTTLAWHCSCRVSLFHITHDFCNYELVPLFKFLHAPLNGAPQKCFQSGPAIAKAGPVEGGQRQVPRLLSHKHTTVAAWRWRHMQINSHR